MAAPAAAAEERAMKNPSVGLLNPAEPPGRGGGGFPEDPETQRDDVLDFLKKEVGSDLKSLKNVGDLLEKLKSENSYLEEQVSEQRLPVCLLVCLLVCLSSGHRPSLTAPLVLTDAFDAQNTSDVFMFTSHS